MVCVAKYVDNQWYRAQVIALPGRRNVDVFYVDFGNVERVSYLKLKYIKETLMVLPVQVGTSLLFFSGDQTATKSKTSRSSIHLFILIFSLSWFHTNRHSAVFHCKPDLYNHNVSCYIIYQVVPNRDRGIVDGIAESLI